MSSANLVTEKRSRRFWEIFSWFDFPNSMLIANTEAHWSIPYFTVGLFLFQAVEYDNSFSNTKYCVAQMMHEALETPEGIKLKHSRTMKELW